MERDIRKIISKMTLEEKANLCSGETFWSTKAIPRCKIPSIMMSDGPHGLRKQCDNADHLGINESIEATCFPTAVGLASSWNRKLIEKLGTALGEECQAEDVQIILGPGTNIKRSPLCGRNFEYFSEDPYLSSELATKYIQSVQNQGVGTSLKHFAANNQETRRFTIDAVVDERTLRELYLSSFETAVISGKPWTVMAAYNKLNGELCSQNNRLLNEILKEEWGFDGFVVSDWGAVCAKDAALSAGLDLEMPPRGGNDKIMKAVNNGTVSMEELNNAVERLLTIIFKATDKKKENAVYSKEAHHTLAREIASECMVLLKNEDNILPLGKKGSIAVIGAFANNPRYQGAGSSKINPTYMDIPYNEIEKIASEAKLSFAQGYPLNSSDINTQMIKEAQIAASRAETAIIFAGLPDHHDEEGTDRVNLKLPDNHNALIEAVAEVQKNAIVILMNGSAVEMPWANKVKGILEAYLGGQAMGGAIADIIFGDKNPSGKLAETFPERLTQTPSYINFPGEADKVEYREGLFVGYKHYDKLELTPLFPFGHGLSYTSFEYSDLTIDKKELLDTDSLKVTVKVKNTGNKAGKEIVQLYISDMESSVIRPVKELKGFEKVSLAPGEEKLITFILSKRAFAYYNVNIKDWHVESGEFQILIGKSSQNLVLAETVNITSTNLIKHHYTGELTVGDVKNNPAAQQLIKTLIDGMGNASGEYLGMDIDSVVSSIKLKNLNHMTLGLISHEMIDELILKMKQEE